jgi:hypothetical protein
MPNVRQMLEDHEREILAKLRSLHDQITPLELELNDVRMAKAALQADTANVRQPQLALAGSATLKVDSAVSGASAEHVVQTTDFTRSPYARLTIKELVLKALAEHFPRGGTANQMLHVFANVWGRGDIVRTSLSPQLSRLKDENRIIRDGHVWHLRHPRTPEKTAADQ